MVAMSPLRHLICAMGLVRRSLQKVEAMRIPFRQKARPTGGGPILDGAYRLHLNDDVIRFTACAAEVFQQQADQFQCFGSDWMGRQFALDRSRMVGGEPQVVLLDPETQEILEIPCGYQEFHEIELVRYPNETVEYDRFKEWLSSGGQVPKYGTCVSPKTPLFLGGKDTFDNLETTDLEVYWSINGQILAQIRDLPEGTVIGKFTISD